MKVLELFCGTKSVGKVCNKKGWTVISVDCDDKCNPTYCCDIKDFDYKQFKEGEFDMVWASPPVLTPELMENDLINEGLPPLHKTLEIIDYLKPKYWFIENPQTGKMKDYIGKDKNFIDVDYCRFGFQYKKKTRIWNNRYDLQSRLCRGIHMCPAMTGKRHNQQIGIQDETRLADRYRVPERLIEYLINNIE